MTDVNTTITTSSTTHSNTQPLPIHIYLGGSFDPVHNSHLAMLQQVIESLASDPTALSESEPTSEPNHMSSNSKKPVVVNQVVSQASIQAYMMPTSRSPLKQNSSSPEHRLNMLMLAITDLKNKSPQHNIAISEAEIWQTPPTYSIDTLRKLRSQHPSASLIFVLGADNIANLSKWRDGDKLTQFAHLWIIPRDQLQHKQHIMELLPQVLKPQVTDTINDLKTQRNGRIYIDSFGVAPISSTAIRKAIYEGEYPVAKTTLPASVYSYIMKNNLYGA